MPSARLFLADGSGWEFFGGNEKGEILISRLAKVANFSPPDSPRWWALWMMAAAKNQVVVKSMLKEVRWTDIPHQEIPKIACRVGPFPNPDKLALQMARIVHIVVHNSEMRGGLLVHGALAEWNGMGVILAGPGGVGKSTAVGRLPRPWRALSDDATMIVKAQDGTYWAHPWPTWSRIRSGEANQSWDVQKAVRLKLICMLAQGNQDRLHELPYLQAISELVDIASQTFVILANGLDIGAIRRINVLRFHNAATIAKLVPIFRLNFSLAGKFWKEIEKDL